MRDADLAEAVGGAAKVPKDQNGASVARILVSGLVNLETTAKVDAFPAL